MDMLWSGWGDPAAATPLPDTVTGLLHDLLGVRSADRTGPDLAEVTAALPDARLSAAARDALAAAVGPDQVRTDAESRVRHTRGKSTPDLLRLRAGQAAAAAPDAVLLPAGHDEVQAVLRICAEHGVPVVPFGGGTSVVGGLAPETALAPR